MEDIRNFGSIIRKRRLELNITMDVLASKAHISRATLSSIENNETYCSFSTILEIAKILKLNFYCKEDNKNLSRQRASRTNTIQNKKINNFIIMCIEQYAEYINENSGNIYKKMKDKGLIDEIKSDYIDLHGMSTELLNEYIAIRLGDIKA